MSVSGDLSLRTTQLYSGGLPLWGLPLLILNPCVSVEPETTPGTNGDFALQ